MIGDPQVLRAWPQSASTMRGNLGVCAVYIASTTSCRGLVSGQVISPRSACAWTARSRSFWAARRILAWLGTIMMALPMAATSAYRC